MGLGLVVLNYNDYETTINFINNIKGYKNIDKIVIVDNNSSNESVEKIKSVIDNRIELIESQENAGYGSGNNIGIKYLEKFDEIKYIGISNPDINFKESDIDDLLGLFERNDRISLLSGRIVENNRFASDGAWRLPTYKECLLQCIPLIDKIINKNLSYDESHYNGEYSIVDIIKGCFFIVKKDVFKDISGFDEKTFLYYEENIIGKKMKEKGYLIATLNCIDIYHMHGETINKSIDKLNRFNILGESRRVYVRDYLNVNKYGIVLYNNFNSIGLFIRKLIYILSDLVNKK